MKSLGAGAGEGHLGYVDRAAVKAAVDALAVALEQLGYKPAAAKA